MRALFWALRIVVLRALPALAIKNGGVVASRCFRSASWQLALLFVMLVFFAMGAAVVIAAALSMVFRRWRGLGLRRGKLDTAKTDPRGIAFPRLGDTIG